MREQAIMQRVQLAASRKGWRVFRNNVGQLQDANGQPIRYGLAVGSSDLIGWRAVTITAEMVGQTFAQFVSLEVKTPAGKPTAAQLNWLDQVDEAGGLAVIVRDPADLAGF